MGNNQQLTEEQQRFIVLKLACFETPTEVAAAVKEEFGLELSKQAVAHYASVEAAEKWKLLYAEARKRYIEDTAEVEVAHQGFRLRELGKLYQRAKKRSADKMAAEFLRQAAEEVGGSYTNRRTLDIGTPEKAAKALSEILGVPGKALPS